VQVVQVVPGQRLSGTLHSRRGSRLWRGKTIPHSPLERFFLAAADITRPEKYHQPE